MGSCSSQTATSKHEPSTDGFSSVRRVGKPSQTDPTGTGMIVNDILTPWNFEATDPFILLHEFGPVDAGTMKVPIGMHPHRGFNEVPYIRQGHMIPTDAWQPQGDPANPMLSGSLQWGTIGSGIEHGGSFDRKYTGLVHGFQMWVNLPAKEKMDPPCFQDAEPDALPVVELSESACVKILVGDVAGQSSPIQSGSVRVQYLDFMLRPGACVEHELPAGYSSVFVYVYQGQGTICSQVARRSDVLQISASGPLSFVSGSTEFGLLLLAGVPLGERIVQHGPFVMATRQQIQQAFSDYQRGGFLNETCRYIRHKASGSVASERKLGAAT
mmetsp:Transcript_81703/g.212487  ORF Transcript_81703/g.212487 Transcript_81703/m.212487 type:complete len:327 (-) Transcript_81703:86-1066(-)